MFIYIVHGEIMIFGDEGDEVEVLDGSNDVEEEGQDEDEPDLPADFQELTAAELRNLLVYPNR